MLESIKKRFTNTFYVQVWSDRIRVVNVRTQEVFDEKPLLAINTNSKGKKIVKAIGDEALTLRGDEKIIIENPFNHPRILFANFVNGEKLLQAIMQKLQKKRIIKLSAAIVIQPMEKLEGGLTMIEKRSYEELALSVGAREVYIHEDTTPIPEPSLIDFDCSPHAQRKNKNTPTLRYSAFLLYILVMIVIISYQLK